MTSIVLELQHDALDRCSPVEDLLRKALVVARKLGVTDLQTWIEHELGGYPEGAEIPDYRTVHGQVKCFNPYRGWIPMIFEDPRQAELCLKRQCNQAVPELESLVGGDGMLQMPFSPEVERQLMRGMPVPMQPTLVVPQTSLAGILNKVRNGILNWALALEQQGILGSGLSFTPREQEVAASSSYNVNNFFGPVGTSSIQQDVENATQVSVSAEVDLSRVREFTKELQANFANLSLTPEVQDELRAEAQTIETQAGSPKPKPAIIRESLRSIRTILEGAAGGAGGALLAKLVELLA